MAACGGDGDAGPVEDDNALQAAASMTAAESLLDDPSDLPVELGPIYSGSCAAVVLGVDDAVEHTTVFFRWDDGWDDVAVVSGDVSERLDEANPECWSGGG